MMKTHMQISNANLGNSLKILTEFLKNYTFFIRKRIDMKQKFLMTLNMSYISKLVLFRKSDSVVSIAF